MSETVQSGSCDVAIIGAGPTGIAAALELKKAGLSRIVVLDREGVAGGIPRHCGHPPFGLGEFGRILSGPSYAKRIVAAARKSGVEIAVKTTVTSLAAEGRLSLITPEGPQELTAKRVLLATGTRETPRSARFISGNRALGICNTGALQSMVYLKNRVPFRAPVVVGTEIVGFSALLTCRKAAIRPVAMLEENSKATVSWPVQYAAALFGVPLHLNSRIVNILGRDRVAAVQVMDHDGNVRELECDGVLFTGKFTPESTLARMSHLALETDTGSPKVDPSGRCSDPAFYAAGNIVHDPVKVAGKCWQAGRDAARHIMKDFS